MEFRPCIDIHNGQVKQIVGSSLVDKDNHAEENFVAAKAQGFSQAALLDCRTIELKPDALM